MKIIDLLEGPKGYDSFGNPLGGGYDEYPPNWKDPQADKPKVVAWIFYDVKPGQEDTAAMYKIRQLKNGKWAMPEYDKSGRTYAFQRNEADKIFGKGKYWSIKGNSPEESAGVGSVSTASVGTSNNKSRHPDSIVV